MNEKLTNMDLKPYVNDETIDELKTLYQMGELDSEDIPEDIETILINKEK